MNLRAAKEIWQAGPVSAAQKLSTIAPGTVWSHDELDRRNGIAIWDPDKVERTGVEDHLDYYRIAQNSASLTPYHSRPLVWPGNIITPDEPDDITEDDSDEAMPEP